MVEVECGCTLCGHLEDKAVVVLCCLALCKFIIGVNLNINLVNLLTRHSVNLHLNSGTRTARSIDTNRIDINTGNGIRMYWSK